MRGRVGARGKRPPRSAREPVVAREPDQLRRPGCAPVAPAAHAALDIRAGNFWSGIIPAKFLVRIAERGFALGVSEPAAQRLLLRLKLRQARGAVLRQCLLAEIAVDLRQSL